MLKLLYEYNKFENDRIIKSLILFIECKKDLEMINNLISDDIIFKILNYDNFMLNETKKMIIDFISELEYSDDELNSKVNFVINEELKEELKCI